MPLDPATWDHDACGVGLLADRHARPSREWLARGLDALVRLTHRGATGDGHGSADGAGVLTAIPWTVVTRDLPPAFRAGDASRAAGMCFLPREGASAARALLSEALEEEGWGQLAWRAVPVDAAVLGAVERTSQPVIWQVFALHQSSPMWPPGRLERSLYRARVTAERRLADARLGAAAIVSLSLRTIVYKALVAPANLARFYPDLADPRYETPFVVFHQRFSTNTFPQWALAQPFRCLAHNGEINTILGNRLHARRRQADHASMPDAPDAAGALVRLTGSDSESLDDIIELHRQAGFSLSHAFARILPRAWEHDPAVPPRERAFEAYQATACEPWEGPAAIAFADGRQVGAVLDRNGFRPARVLTTRDGMVGVGSETGIFDAPESDVDRRGRLGPGEMLIVDLETGRLLDNSGLRRALAAEHPYREWLDRAVTDLAARAERSDPSPEPGPHASASSVSSLVRQRIFGYTAEEVALILRPMAEEGKEAVGSMGDDTPLAVLSRRRRLLPDYFRQRFAQVTNPPIDPLREQAVMSLRTTIGRRGRLLEESPVDARLVSVASPILTSAERDALASLSDRPAVVLPITYDPCGGEAAFQGALDRVCRDAVSSVQSGAVVLVLTDRDAGHERAPLPALLATSAVWQGLGRAGLGARAGLVVDTGEVRDAHQAAALLAFGAAAVCPWLAYETARGLATEAGEDARAVVERYRRALEQGVLKVMSKMGVCTVAAYHGSQLMEIVGLDASLVDTYFPDTASVPGSVTLASLARDSVAWHASAVADPSPHLPHPGFHGFRNGGDFHAWNPALVKQFHRAVARRDPGAYEQFTALVHGRPPVTVRDLLRFKPQAPVPLHEVEPVERIWARFFASAMSVGALGPEAHRTLAIAMNRMRARSNSGEGGEEPERFPRPADGDWAGSSTKQVASARFGVTPAYLLSATELQIKMAQGSKPGEGGQIPGPKVVDHIARLRRAQPLTPLISPPPHHDIYSIEDLAQLIYDLRSLHPSARINVKLVATSGVGIIAAGVVKAGADAIQISGHDGGTGASPRGSIKHAGLPWELGVADAHRVLMARGSRHRAVLQTDGGLKTGRDVAMAAALGADEFGFGTAALVAIGCVMARQCHLNSCPAGIATQKAELRAKYAGTPDQVVTYFRMVAEEVRAILASLGLRSIAELVGRVDLLEVRERGGAVLDVASLLAPVARRDPLDGGIDPEHGPAGRLTLNGRILAEAVERGLGRSTSGRPATAPIIIRASVQNTDRAVAATLAGAIARAYGDAGCPETPVRLELTGHAGQSLGAFGVPGLDLHLAGDANDGVAKGLAGGTVVIAPPSDSVLADQALVGNAALYGATGGRLFVAGRAGERFAVRNSGATAVVEGVGHHACEYMTGGIVVVLGPSGRNFAAGMTGGVAYVYDPERSLEARLNAEVVALGGLDGADAVRLADLLRAHLDLTASRRAAALLADWGDTLAAFCKVLPRAAAAVLPARPEEEPERLRA
jgi:glutamate synthase domain-containing protein 2/glutamate synthase domain-containing protein 1/glutamate synthase domain-containing protein 3